MTHPLFDSGVRDYWKGQGIPTRGNETPGRSTEFYHGSKRSLDGHTHVDARARGRASSGSADHVNWFASGTPEHARRNFGANVYRVEPTGPFTDNFDTPGELFGEYASEHPLRILSKVQFGGDR
jgi:hypothetical protein